MRTEPSISSPINHEGAEENFDSPYLADYRQRYGLSSDPFNDDPHFPFYTGAERRLILEKLVHLCQFGNNLLVVGGEYSTGKTRMAQALIDSLEDEDDICFVEGQVTSQIPDVLDDILDQFELQQESDLGDFFEKTPEREGLAVVIVDNAHHLSDDVLKEIVLLVRNDSESRLRLVFFGEPLLLQRLEQMDVHHVVMTDFILQRFNLTEAVDYLNFRMEMADYLGPEIFTEAMVEPWWRSANGQIDRLHACAQQKLLESVSQSSSRSSLRNAIPIPHILAVAVLASILIMILVYFGKSDDANSKSKNIASSTNSSISTTLSSIASHSLSDAVNLPVAIESSRNASSASASQDQTTGENLTTQTQEKSAQENLKPQTSTAEVKDNLAVASKQSERDVGVGAEKSNQKENQSSKATKKISKKDDLKNTDLSSMKSSVQTAETNGQYSDQEKAILSWDDSEHTLQLMVVSSEKSVREFIENQKNKNELFVFKRMKDGKEFFVVICGRYATAAEAKVAAQQLPDSEQKSAPWSRTIRSVKNEIRSR